MRPVLFGLAAALAAAVVGVLVFAPADTAGPRLAERTPPATATPPPPDATENLDPGHVGAIVTGSGLRLTTHTGRRRRGSPTLAIDNRSDRLVKVVLARDSSPPRLVVGVTVPRLDSLYNQFDVRAGRYLVIVRDPASTASGPVDTAALRVR